MRLVYVSLDFFLKFWSQATLSGSEPLVQLNGQQFLNIPIVFSEKFPIHNTHCEIASLLMNPVYLKNKATSPVN